VKFHLQQAIRELVELPEVLSILTENIEVVILVGDAYTKYPEWVLRKADSLHIEIATQRAIELEDWKKTISENPELVEDLQATAKEFENEYRAEGVHLAEVDYDDVYNVDAEDAYVFEDHKVETKVVDRIVIHHYPYWYGYPHWFSFPRWRPYPYWYDWGFQIHPGRNIVITHLPSFFFVEWYFYYPHHHFYFPHLSARFIHHYHNHRRSGSSISVTAQDWYQSNRAVISSYDIANAPRRVNTFRDFGRMEQARINYNDSNPGQRVSQRQFLDRNKNKYHGLRSQPARISPRVDRSKTEYQRIDNPLNIRRFPDKIRNQHNNQIRIDRHSPRINISPAHKGKENEIHRRTWEKTRFSPKEIKPSSRIPIRKKKSTPRNRIKKRSGLD